MRMEMPMAKYYVRSGKLREVVARSSREQAAYDVVQRAARSGDGRFFPIHALQHLGLITTVSERGFQDKAATCYATDGILCRVGSFEQFRADEQEED